MKAHQDNPSEGKDQVSDQVKFNVFQGIMDSLFQSFNASISVASFQELSACVFSWIEEHCKPQVRAPRAGAGSSPSPQAKQPKTVAQESKVTAFRLFLKKKLFERVTEFCTGSLPQQLGLAALKPGAKTPTRAPTGVAGPKCSAERCTGSGIAGT